MKKASGFEKFYKGKEVTGAAKKEQIKKEKRVVRKEREDRIAAAKRQQRAERNSNSGDTPRPPKYNLEPPVKRGGKADTRPGNQRFKPQKRAEGAPKKDDRPQRSFGGDKRENKPFQPRSEGRPPFKDRDKHPREARQNEGPRLQKSTRRDGDARPYKSDDHRGVGHHSKPARQPIEPKSKINTDAQMPLNKYIAHSGMCSRRDAVDLVKAGKVKVNGELVLEPGHKVSVSDEVKVAGKKLNPVKDFVYILLNKPKDYITTTDDPQQRKTVLDLLKNAPPARIYPVGRLDRNTSGVLLLTNDGDLSQKLTHPSNEIKKVYAVTLDKPLTRQHFEEILKGIPLDDGMAHVDVLAYTDTKDHSQVGVELHSGRNRVVRRIFEHLGYDVRSLDRVVFAGLTKKNVNRGKWRFLTEKEVRDLKFFRRGRG